MRLNKISFTTEVYCLRIYEWRRLRELTSSYVFGICFFKNFIISLKPINSFCWMLLQCKLACTTYFEVRLGCDLMNTFQCIFLHLGTALGFQDVEIVANFLNRFDVRCFHVEFFLSNHPSIQKIHDHTPLPQNQADRWTDGVSQHIPHWFLPISSLHSHSILPRAPWPYSGWWQLCW